MIALLRLIGGGLLGYGKSLLSGIAWLFEDWRRVLILSAILGAVYMAFTIRTLNNDVNEQTSKADKAKAALAVMKEQYQDFAADVARERAEALRLDHANAQRKTKEMEQIKERTAHEYEVQLTDTKRALNKLRERVAAVDTAENRSHGGNADLPRDYSARCKAFGFADCDALLATLPGLLAAAEENTARLIALQSWAKGILAVDMNGGGGNTTE